MLFKKITYQTIRNYELWKKKTQQKQSTNSTKNTLRNLRTEKSKGKESKDKVEVNPKFTFRLFYRRKAYTTMVKSYTACLNNAAASLNNGEQKPASLKS